VRPEGRRHSGVDQFGEVGHVDIHHDTDVQAAVDAGDIDVA
jgi:hypothetical protein